MAGGYKKPINSWVKKIVFKPTGKPIKWKYFTVAMAAKADRRTTPAGLLLKRPTAIVTRQNLRIISSVKALLNG